MDGTHDQGDDPDSERGMRGDGEEWKEAGWYVSSYSKDKPNSCRFVNSKHDEKLRI